MHSAWTDFTKLRKNAPKADGDTPNFNLSSYKQLSLLKEFADHHFEKKFLLESTSEFQSPVTFLKRTKTLSYPQNEIFYFAYCKFGNFRGGLIFVKLPFCQVSRKYNPQEMVKSICCLLTQMNQALIAIFTWQICLLTLFAKIKLSRKFTNLQ